MNTLFSSGCGRGHADTAVAYQDATHWTLVYQRRSQDDNRTADIGITQTRRGAELTALKEVKPVDTPDSASAFRNQNVLTLLAAPRAARLNSA